MSDAQLAAYFRKYEGRICGRFLPDQLAKDLQLPKRSWPGLRYFFTFSIPAFLLSLKATAQLKSQVPDSVQSAGSRRVVMGGVASLPVKDSLLGKVRDEAGNPVPFATVAVKGRKEAVSCDHNGTFRIAVNMPATLIVSAAGFEMKEFPVQSLEVLELQLTMSQMTAGEVIVVRSKRPKRFISLFKSKPAPVAVPPSIQVFPNPVEQGSDLTIEGRNLPKGAYFLELYTVAGQLVRKGIASCGSDKEQMKLATSGLLPGNYIVRVVSEKTGKALSQQVVIQ